MAHDGNGKEADIELVLEGLYDVEKDLLEPVIFDKMADRDMGLIDAQPKKKSEEELRVEAGEVIDSSDSDDDESYETGDSGTTRWGYHTIICEYHHPTQAALRFLNNMTHEQVFLLPKLVETQKRILIERRGYETLLDAVSAITLAESLEADAVVTIVMSLCRSYGWVGPHCG